MLLADEEAILTIDRRLIIYLSDYALCKTNKFILKQLFEIKNALTISDLHEILIGQILLPLIINERHATIK